METFHLKVMHLVPKSTNSREADQETCNKGRLCGLNDLKKGTSRQRTSSEDNFAAFFRFIH